MSRTIKNLRPSLNSRYKQGYIDQNTCRKLFPQLKHDNIIYRSSYEKKFIYFLENNDNIKYWGSECFHIPYYSVLDKKIHKYYPDYFIELQNGTCIVVEVKPYNQTHKPINENSWTFHEYIKNMCKWKATKEFCEAKGYLFRIITEKTINQL